MAATEIARWRLNEQEGGNSQELLSETNYAINSAEGDEWQVPPNAGFLFNGSDEFIDIDGHTSLPLDLTTAWSFLCHIKWPGAGGDLAIFSFSNTGDNNPRIVLYGQGSTGKLFVKWNNDAGSVVCQTPVTTRVYDDDAYATIAFSITGNTLSNPNNCKLYTGTSAGMSLDVDHDYTYAGTTTQNAATIAALRRTSNIQFWNGVVRDARIFTGLFANTAEVSTLAAAAIYDSTGPSYGVKGDVKGFVKEPVAAQVTA